MPAKSKDQQRAAAIALSAKRKGEVDELPDGAAKDMAQSMSEEELDKLASTKHKGLPEKKKEAKEWAGSSLVEVFKEQDESVENEEGSEEEELNEETLELADKAEENAEGEITTQKSKVERLDDLEIGTGKDIEDMKSSTPPVGDRNPAVAQHNRSPMSTNVRGARVSEDARDDWDEPWGHGAAGASEELMDRDEEKLFDELWSDYQRLNAVPTIEDAEETFNDLFKHYPEAEDEDIIARAVHKVEELAGSSDEMEEAAPKGWEGTVKAMKDEEEVDNPYALAHWMKKKGYKSHKESIDLARWQQLAGIPVKTNNILSEKKWMQDATNPKEEGEFTQKAESMGMGVQEYADYVLKRAREGSWKGDEETVNQAKFAKAAKSVAKESAVKEKTPLKEMNEAQLKRYVKRLAMHGWSWEDVATQLADQYGVRPYEIAELKAVFEGEVQESVYESVVVDENDLSLIFEE